MYKKALRNLLYNVGIFASVMGGIYAFDRRSIILALVCIGALVFFVMEKYKIMKEIKNLPPPPRKSK